MLYRVKEGYTLSVGRGQMGPGFIISPAVASLLDISRLLKGGMIEEIKSSNKPRTSSKSASGVSTSRSKAKAKPAPKTKD